MESVSFIPLMHVPGCSKCSQPHKGHPLPFGGDCALVLAKEHADESRDFPACSMEDPAALPLPGPSSPGEPPAVDSTAPVLTEQQPKPPARTAHKQPVALITTMTTITTGGSSDCSLAVLSMRFSQQDEQSARDRCQINELSQQLSDTTTQLTHISKVLDGLLASHTPMATLAEFPAVPSFLSASGTAPLGKAPSVPQQRTASGKANPSTSTFHINGQMASHSHAGTPQSSSGLQYQAFSFQGQTQTTPGTTLPRPFIPSEPLLQFPLSLGTPTLGQHSALNQQQHLQAPVPMGLPGATKHSTMDSTFYSRAGLATFPTMGPFPHGSQTATSAPSRAMDIATMAKVIPNMPLKLQQRIIQGEFTMAKVIPNMPLKLQQRIIQGEFIDLSELLHADFQFKCASIDSNDAFELVHKDKIVLMWPRKKGKQIDCLSMWLMAWALYEQVMVYTYPQRHSELAYYRNFIMQQDKKFIWSAVQMYDIRFQAMCAHHNYPFTTMDQTLMATILNATTVKTSAHKCFRCGGFDHLVDRCPFPQAASLKMAGIMKKGMQVRQTSKSCSSKATSPVQSDKWFHNWREGCNKFQLDGCTFPHCK